MFARGISILIGSAVDPGNIPVPRPSDHLVDRCAQAAMRALQARPEYLSPLERMDKPEAWAAVQRRRREQLESFLWVDSNPQILERIVDLCLMICEEPNWSANGAGIEDPGHPAIDFQAAETGMLLAWILHRHGAKLNELCPRLNRVALDAVRRRLLGPILAHDDYPFMRGSGSRAGLILSDLLLCCLLMEASPSRRQQPVKALLHLLDRLCLTVPNTSLPLVDRLADACALSDLARLLKRLTRGELDLTREVPPPGRLDDLIIPWIGGEYFLDPGGSSMHPEIAGMDMFRLGYLNRDRALCALGAQLHRAKDRPSASLSGRILSMEYMRAAEDEFTAPPKLKRAQSEDGGLMVSRVDGLIAAITRGGARANCGDITLFAETTPIFGDMGGKIHSLPLLDETGPLDRPLRVPASDVDFGEDRDMMTIDLTDAYPESAGLSAYQRTLMTMRADGSVRLVDAFEFMQPPKSVTFRFICARKPLSLRDSVRLGPVSLFWDGDMMPETAELPGGMHLLRFVLRDPPRRLICGFSLERN